MIQPPFTRKLAQEAVKQAAKSAAAGATAILRRLAEAVPGTPGLVLRGASVAAGFFSRD